MAHLSNHHIKGFLTIIVKIVLSVLIIINLSCNKNKMDKQSFKVFGEEALLKDCKINISIYTQIGYDNTTSKYIDTEKLETLLFNGNTYEVKSLKDHSVYTIYFSHKDSLVNVFKYENIMGGEESQINHLYLYKNKDAISFKFVGNEEFLQEMEDRPINVLIPVDEYFSQKRMVNEDSINKEKQLFFDFYGK
jgi:hypothetical protein